MKSHFNLPLIPPSGAALLTAAGVPSSMDASRSAVDVIKTCLRAAARKWPDAPIGAWVSVADHLESRLREAAVSDDTPPHKQNLAHGREPPHPMRLNPAYVREEVF